MDTIREVLEAADQHMEHARAMVEDDRVDELIRDFYRSRVRLASAIAACRIEFDKAPTDEHIEALTDEHIEETLKAISTYEGEGGRRFFLDGWNGDAQKHWLNAVKWTQSFYRAKR